MHSDLENCAYYSSPGRFSLDLEVAREKRPGDEVVVRIPEKILATPLNQVKK